VNKVEKLIPTLRKTDKYVLHHRNLKQYLEMGDEDHENSPWDIIR